MIVAVELLHYPLLIGIVALLVVVNWRIVLRLLVAACLTLLILGILVVLTV